jgi:predicted methyltransferase
MRAMRTRTVLLSLLCIAATAGCGGGANNAAPTTPSGADAANVGSPRIVKVAVAAEHRAVVESPDRDEADKKLDAGRHPGETLSFFGVKPGQKVADLAAGGGYTTEILARAVGEKGVVYSQNNAMIVERFAGEPWAARLAKPVNKNVVRVVREFDDPLPPEATELDAVFDVLFYHDTVWLGTDRAKMNAAIFRALKPGGVYAIIDHSGRAGTGTKESDSLHRIEESVVRKEILAAGFTLPEEADFMRNAADTRDWNASPGGAGAKRGTSDRFVLKFVKPAK